MLKFCKNLVLYSMTIKFWTEEWAVPSGQLVLQRGKQITSMKMPDLSCTSHILQPTVLLPISLYMKFHLAWFTAPLPDNNSIENLTITLVNPYFISIWQAFDIHQQKIFHQPDTTEVVQKFNTCMYSPIPSQSNRQIFKLVYF